MEKKGWKILAIVFICLFSFSLISFAIITSIGINIINKEYECSVECVNLNENAAYMFYDYENICECYVNNKLIKTIYIE